MTQTVPLVPLDDLPAGAHATVRRLDAKGIANLGLESEELERRLLESGLVEGVRVRIVHEAPLTRDPIAVVLDEEGIIALRRREARAVKVERL